MGNLFYIRQKGHTGSPKSRSLHYSSTDGNKEGGVGEFLRKGIEDKNQVTNLGPLLLPSKTIKYPKLIYFFVSTLVSTTLV